MSPEINYKSVYNQLSLTASILLCMFLVLAAMPTEGHARSKKQVSTRSTGLLKVLVPAQGMHFDNYWIYVDGKLVNRPPRISVNEDAYSANATILVSKGGGGYGKARSNNGWMFIETNGLVLDIQHERWNTTMLNKYANAPDPDALHIFNTFQLPLRPGKLVVEVAFYSFSFGGVSSGGEEFPFVFTEKHEMVVQRGETATLYVAIPDRWQYPVPVAVAARMDGQMCQRSGNAPPDLSQLQRWIDTYMEDPIVKALHDAHASHEEKSRGVVVLDLPEELGGSREYDRKQIAYLSSVIAPDRVLPDREEIASCQKRYPHYSRSYAEYGKLLEDIYRDLASFKELAGGIPSAEGK